MNNLLETSTGSGSWEMVAQNESQWKNEQQRKKEQPEEIAVCRDILLGSPTAKPMPEVVSYGRGWKIKCKTEKKENTKKLERNPRSIEPKSNANIGVMVALYS